MSNEETTILAIKGSIYDLPAEEQIKVNALILELRQKIVQQGPSVYFAIALLGAELQMKTEFEKT